MIDIPAIEAAARAATPGPWWTDITNGPGGAVCRSEEVCAHGHFNICGKVAHAPNRAWIRNATHIATANPETVLALCAEVRRLKALVDDGWTHPEEVAAERARLTARAERAEAALPRWIPVGERMPEPDSYVLAYNGDRVQEAKWDSGKYLKKPVCKWQRTSGGLFWGAPPTHWAPLPPGPTT